MCPVEEGVDILILYDNNRDYRDEFRNFWNDKVKKVRKRSLIVGIIMIVLGILCLVFPVRSIYFLEVIASLVMIFIGIYEIAAFFMMPIFFRFGGGLLAGILNIMLGIILLSSPPEEMITAFGFIIAIDVLIFGIEELSAVSKAKYFGAGDTGWLTANGILSVICGIVLIFLPQASVALSIILAVYLLVGGISLLSAAANAKEF
jgi:uncharacterized membrane protein HdeD (DUF308 family)